METAAPPGLEGYSAFQLRRVLERLREGLYDPLAVHLLTAHRAELDARLLQDLSKVEAGAGAHRCVCGPYGQGKSHTLAYLQEAALQQGYAVSAINLDPREAPLHQFRQVYRALLHGLTFPAVSETLRLTHRSSTPGAPGPRRRPAPSMIAPARWPLSFPPRCRTSSKPFWWR